MPRIRIIEQLPQARWGRVVDGGDPDEEWIKKLLQFEGKHGSPTYGPLSDFGFHCPYGYKQVNGQCVNKQTGQPLSKDPAYKTWKAPASIDEAVDYYKQQFLPLVQQYPMGLRERMGDYIYNTGRNPNDLLLLASGLATLDEVNSSDPQVVTDLKNRFIQNENKIKAVMSKPEFIASIDNSRDQLYRTIGSYQDPSDPSKKIKYTVKNPNPTYNAAWARRMKDLYGYTAPAMYPQYNINAQPAAPSPSAPRINTPQANTQLTPPAGGFVPANFIGPLSENQQYEAPNFNLVAPAPPGFNRDASGRLVQDPTFDESSIERPESDEIPTFTEDELNRRLALLDKKDKEADRYLAPRTPGLIRDVNKLGYKIREGVQQGAKDILEDPTAQKIFGTGNKIYKALMVANPFIQMITDSKRQKRFDKYVRQNALPDLSYPVRPASMTGNRGDWDINTGIFRPDEIGFRSKGMYTNRFDYPSIGTGANYSFAKQGGSINSNPMQKVRIRILDSDLEKMATGGQPMTYSGQLGYGINLGQKRIYTDMPPEKTETLNGKLKPAPREQANLEAEVDETAWADVDGDGAREHMVIGGKKHSEGGTPLNLPEGSFIFSDSKDLKIKDPAILARFNMPPKKGGYTPAEIAKKYDVNKYKAIIEDPNSDPIRKATAQIMVKTFNKKLAELALIQEQMKGFPQGIPEAVKEVMPNLQTREDNERQPGVSDTEVYSDEELAEQQQGAEEGMQQPMMEYGGGMVRFAPGGISYTTNTTTIPPFIPSISQFAPVNPQGVGQPTGVPTTTDPEEFEQTYTPKQKAPLSDPEFNKFIGLVKKYDTGRYRAQGKYHVANLPAEDAAEFARLATKFGFKRQAEGNVKGYTIVQGGTSNYTFTDRVNGKDVSVGFFAGFTPEMFERRLVEDVYGKEASDKMTDLERRKAYFKELGVDISGITDAKLSNSKILYKDKNFFNTKFYPAFKSKFGETEYRPEMGSIGQIGAEHYDGYRRRVKPVPSDGTVMGYKCVGRDANGKANIQSNSYVSTEAMIKDGAVANQTEAYKQCPETPITPNPLGEGGCPPGYSRNAKGECAKIPFDFMTPDKVNMLAAIAVPPKLRMPWGQKLPFEPGDVVFQDWRARAAERQGLFNRMANQLNTYSPGRATASNLAFLAAQQSEGLVKDIADVDAYNVQVANAFSAQERQRKDMINSYNLAKAEQLYREGVIGKQAYDNAKRQYYNNYAKAFGQAWKNRMNLGLLNAVNPMFNIDPYEGQSWFKGGYGPEDLTGAMASGTASGTSFQDKVSYYLKRGYTNEEARQAAIADDRKASGSGLTARQSQYNQMRSMLPSYGTGINFGNTFYPDEES